MIKINTLSTLYVGIDVSSKSMLSMPWTLNRISFFLILSLIISLALKKLANAICKCMLSHRNLNTIVFALESTSMYSIHIANFLSASEILMPFHPYVYCLNPKITANYRKTFIGLSKTDSTDAYIISDLARVGKIKSSPLERQLVSCTQASDTAPTAPR